uniref:Uncharacterized protein n=1 Tax=viral metagenome TaxID=1070528 RepID=A0A6M3L2G9_9ZZZZ
MKFNYAGTIEVGQLESGDLIVTVGDGYFYRGHEVILKDDLKHFSPADCEALNLVDPDRTERLCQQ